MITRVRIDAEATTIDGAQRDLFALADRVGSGAAWCRYADEHYEAITEDEQLHGRRYRGRIIVHFAVDEPHAFSPGGALPAAPPTHEPPIEGLSAAQVMAAFEATAADMGGVPESPAGSGIYRTPRRRDLRPGEYEAPAMEARDDAE